MHRMRLVGLTIIAALALSAVMAASAFATSGINLLWKSGGTELTGSLAITAAANGNQELTSAAAETITCKGLSISGGTISNSSKQGVDKEKITYTECVYGAGTCKVSTKGAKTWGTITTAELNSELAFATKAEAEKEEVLTAGTLTLFKPVSGAFVALEFEGSGCPLLTNVSVEGAVAAKNTGTPLVEELTHGLEAPSSAIAEGFVTKSGKTEAVKTKLTAFGLKAAYIGKSNVTAGSDYSIGG
jgi:hypothetical protein